MLNRTKAQKASIRVSVTLDDQEYAELSKLAATLDLSTAWMIRRAVSEFIVRHQDGIEADLPLRLPRADLVRSRGGKKAGGSRGR